MFDSREPVVVLLAIVIQAVGCRIEGLTLGSRLVSRSALGAGLLLLITVLGCGAITTPAPTHTPTPGAHTTPSTDANRPVLTIATIAPIR